MRNPFLPTIAVAFLLPLASGLSQQNPPKWPGQGTPAPAGDNGPTTGSISFPNSPVGDVIAYYELITGKKVIRDNNLNNATVTIFAAKPMPKEQAAQFIESALLLNGIALVPTGDDTLKALNTSNRKPVAEVVPLFTGTQGIPDGDGVISYFMPLKYISPEEAKKTFEAHVTLHDYGTLTIAPGGTSLLITENGRLVKRLIELQGLLDKEPNKVASEFVQLQRADAIRVAELVSNALTPPEKSGPSGAGGGGAPRPPGQPGAAEPGAISVSSAGGLIGGDLKLVPDERTNRILIIAAPSNIPVVRNMIVQFDVAAELSKPVSRTLRYISVAETLPILVNVLGGPGDKQDSTSNPGGGNIPRAIPVNPGAQGSSGGLSSAGSSAGGAAADQLSDSQESEGLISAEVGKTWMVGDPKSNLIMISGPPESVAKANLILNQLDQKPKQVYLATVIGELTVGHNMELGINYLQSYNKDYKFGSGFVGNALGGAAVQKNGLLDPTTILGAASGLTFYGVIGDAAAYYIHALEGTNRFKVLSRPVVFTSNNKRAKIASGQKIPVPTSTISQLNDGGGLIGNAANSVFGSNVALQSNITFEDVLLKLEVVPLINANGEVTLKIVQTNNSVVGSQQVSGNSIPIIGTQELNTTITVKNRQTIVLGGLVSESIKKDYSGIPLLCQIPYLGYAFRTTTTERDRKELMIFIQPVVIDDNAQAVQVTADEKMRTEIPSDVGDQLKFENGTPGIKALKAVH